MGLYPEVWRLCAALVGRGAADDLAQETVLRAVRSLRGFRGDATARTWVLAIARRACMDELRTRERRRRRDRSLAPESDSGSTAADPADRVAVEDLLSGLEPERRAAFLLTQLLGLSYEEAAAACDCPVGTIRSRVARAREELVSLVSVDRGRTRGISSPR